MQNNKFFVLAGVICAMLLSALDQTIVSTAMPQIVRQLNGVEHLSWVFTAYMLASTVIVPIYGKLSDMFGPRRFFLAGIFIFLVGSVLSGVSQSMTQLIAFRAIQGLGGGAMMVNAMSIIGDVFPPQERGKWQGLLGGIFGLASIAGPLLGGWITDNLSWRWVFYVNIPVGILAMIIIAAALPKITHDVKSRSIDFLGALLITTGLVPLLLGLVWGGSQYAWGSWQIIGLLATALVSLVLFGLVERRAREPILALDLFRNRVFLVSVLSLFLIGMGMFGAILYIPVFAQGVVGISATSSGLVMTPMMVALIIASAVGGQIVSRTGKYKALAVAGFVITVIGMASFTWVSVDTTQAGLFLRMAILGLGLGTAMPIFTIAVQAAFAKERLGEVTAGTQLFRSIGGTVGTAVLGGVMNGQLAGRLQDIAKDPFVSLMRSADPSAALGTIDANTVQGVLSPEAQEQIRVGFWLHGPAGAYDRMNAAFEHFLQTIKLAFTASIDRVFLVSAALMAVGLVVVLFLPQVGLSRKKKPVLEEIGTELDLELGQADAAREPVF
jgi:EmrB/QacA subfamily drug resistance transporter